jgi:hypothetical protein
VRKHLYFRLLVTHFVHSMTRRFSSLFALALTSLLATRCSLCAGTTNTAPDFKEVYDLLRANFPGATAENLNRAAVEGLLAQFPGKVSLVGGAADGALGLSGGPALSKSVVIEGNVAYLRVNRVSASLADELGAAYRALAGTNKIAGAVLDLRFAGGSDDTAAQTAAKLFTAKKLVTGPLAVVVNGETRGTAEVLAAVLHQAGAGLILGSPTTGAATAFKEFPLSNGERLRVAAAPAASGGSMISRVQPDIAVTGAGSDERVWFDNPYQTLATGNTNSSPGTNFLPYVDHTSEADLVRQRQKDGKLIKVPMSREDLMREKNDGGDGDEDSAPVRAAEPQKPVIRDPVLARAVDLVKGLAIVHESRP